MKKSSFNRILESRESTVVGYPAISGVAQSHNFYPFSYMKTEDGVARIVLGMGTGVSEENALRFSPEYPNFLPPLREN